MKLEKNESVIETRRAGGVATVTAGGFSLGVNHG